MTDNVNISPDMIDKLVNMFKKNNPSSDSNSSSENQNPLGNLDIETIMRIKSIMDSLNDKNDNDSNLLYSLKPYLRKSRQAKLDQYINILKISQISKLYKNNSGDDK